VIFHVHSRRLASWVRRVGYVVLNHVSYKHVMKSVKLFREEK